MQTLYRLNADELNQDFLASLQTLFRHKTIQIVVSEIAEETFLPPLENDVFLRRPASEEQEEQCEESADNLFQNETNRRRLLERMDYVERGGETVAVSVEQLQKIVRDNAP